MIDEIVKSMNHALARRAILRKLVFATGALVAGVFARPRSAFACYECCNLCFAPSTECSGCTCTWGWSCTVNEECKVYRCEECIVTPTAPCSVPCQDNPSCSTCNGVTCSKKTYVGWKHGCIPNHG